MLTLRPEPMSRVDRLLLGLAALAACVALAWVFWGGSGNRRRLLLFGELSTAGLLFTSGASLLRVSRQRGRMVRHAGRLAAYNAVLAHANQVIAAAAGEDELLRGICDIAIEHAGFALAAVTRPDSAGRLRAVAAAGTTGYLDEVEITATADRPTGRGPMALSWREGRAHFSPAFDGLATLLPWREAAQRWSLGANATLPLRRGGRIWAVLALYHRDATPFTPELRALLLELANDVSAALDRMDLRDAEAAERERRILQQDLLRSLLGNIDLLISASDAGRLLPDFCTRLLESGLLIAAWIGRPDEQRRLIPLAWGGQADEVLLATPAPCIDEVPVLRDAWDHARQASDSDPASPLLQGWSGYATAGMGQEAIVMPIRREGTPWALLVTIAQAAELDADLRAILARVSELLGLALEDIELKENLRNRQREEAHRARHDPLTGMPNRLGLENHVAGAIARARRKGTRVAVGLIDLDDFKPVNDSHGHEAGDRVLIELSRRWQSRLRESDLLGRLGGDEFVVVIEDIDDGAELTQLSAVVGRLHEAVEQPFDIAPGCSASLGMTMGLALFPQDGDDTDILLRHADAAMYQAKAHKLVRTQWWRVWGHTDATPEIETPVDPYGAEAAEILREAEPLFSALADHFVAEFYDPAGESTQSSPALRDLQPQRLEALKGAQARHLRFLSGAATSRAAVETEGRRLGRVHALVGVNGAMLSRARALYRSLLAEQLNVARLTARQRYRLLGIAEARLQDDLQAQHQTGQEVEGEYMRALARPVPPQGTLWVDASRDEIRMLGELPGMRCVMLMRLNPAGAFDIEEAAGPVATEVGTFLQAAGMQAVVEPASERGRGMASLAWRSLRIQHTGSFQLDPGYAPWAGDAERLGLRAAMAVPIVGRDGRVAAVLSLIGAYHRQFESTWMQQWAAVLQRRWEGILAQSGGVGFAVLPLAQASMLRERLYGGGLTMQMQPVIDLRRRALARVEVLARLRLDDGAVVSPAEFLPLLGNAELDHVFRGMLDQTLAHMREWDARGLRVDASINLPPSTLLDPDCAQRVAAALRGHGVEPGRLAFELLETGSIENAAQQQAAAALLAVGVGLVMDDLGAGHSSILRLSRMPFDTIKVDKSLWQQLDANPLQTVTLLGTLVTMCTDLGRDVVIEGLEDDAMIEVATQLGASHGQGYAFARPMPPQDLPAWIAANPLDSAPGAIRSYAGALACHWRRQHPSRSAPAPADDPATLDAFLERQGLRDSMVWDWHAASGRGEADATLLLADWLAERVREAA